MEPFAQGCRFRLNFVCKPLIFDNKKPQHILTEKRECDVIYRKIEIFGKNIQETGFVQ